MNRIREVRERRGWSIADLAKAADTSPAQISRLETGERRLSLEWMMRLARALDAQPFDLIAQPEVADFAEEATPYTATDPIAAQGLAARHLFLHRATSNSLTALGVNEGDVLLFDFSADAVARVATGDIVLVTAHDEGTGEQRTLLRQFLAPSLLTTNRPGINQSISIPDASFALNIRAVRVQFAKNGKDLG